MHVMHACDIEFWIHAGQFMITQCTSVSTHMAQAIDNPRPLMHVSSAGSMPKLIMAQFPTCVWNIAPMTTIESAESVHAPIPPSPPPELLDPLLELPELEPPLLELLELLVLPLPLLPLPLLLLVLPLPLLPPLLPLLLLLPPSPPLPDDESPEPQAAATPMRRAADKKG